MQSAADIPHRPRRMTVSALQGALRSELRVKLPRREGDPLLRRLDPSGRGALDWHLLVRLVDRGIGRVGGVPGTENDKDVDVVVARLRKPRVGLQIGTPATFKSFVDFFSKKMRKKI